MKKQETSNRHLMVTRKIIQESMKNRLMEPSSFKKKLPILYSQLVKVNDTYDFVKVVRIVSENCEDPYTCSNNTTYRDEEFRGGYPCSINDTMFRISNQDCVLIHSRTTLFIYFIYKNLARSYSIYNISLHDLNKSKFIKEMDNELETYIKIIDNSIAYNKSHEIEQDSDRDEFIEAGKKFSPSFDDIMEPVDIKPYEGVSGSIQEKFITIVGNLSKLTSEINEKIALNDIDEIGKRFIEAKQNIAALSMKTKPNKTISFLDKFTNKIPGIDKVKKSLNNTITEILSVQSNIDYLFGVIHSQYNTLIEKGEGLQKAKSQLESQIDELVKISNESDKHISSFENEVEIPIRELALDTQIKSSIEKYKNRLLKIDGAIIATQTTIVALGKDLPALKTDLTDEMAIGGLLNSVDKYQAMYTEVATLVSDVTRDTAEKTHNVIENLLEMQINDTHTMTYLAESTKRGERFANMIQDKTTKLALKVHRDAKFIEEIIMGSTTESARKRIQLLK
jgi:hypothetical protein